MTPRRRSRPERLPARVVWAVLISLLLHVPLGVWFARSTYLNDDVPEVPPPLEFSFLRVAPPTPEETAEDEPEEELEEPSGQIVEIAPPENQTPPEEADFLAEYDSTVPEETVDPRSRPDRTVTAETYSPDDLYELESQVAQRTTSTSTGASKGSRAFRDGRFSHFPDPSLFDFTDQEGVADDVLSSHTQNRLAGSPSADFLPDIAIADRTALNAHEFVFAAFWNRVKRMVEFYANQTLANAYPKTPVTRRRYQMTLKGLIALDGRLAAIEIVQPSGIPAFDAAIKEAFTLAAPFPDPPEAAAEADGYIHMRSFGFVIDITSGRTEMSGIDPRQNVQFPGLQTYPR